MTDIYIISGFLGAGKTTLIQTMVKHVFQDQKIVVIENDFGEAGIDAGLLTECQLTVTSLSSGCICCSMTGDFEKAVKRIVKEYEPQVILVEPSGVGKLSDVIKSCCKQRENIRLKRCITVVDVTKFDKYEENYGEFFSNQILYADLVLLSHQDEKVKEAVEKIRKINEEARIETGLWDLIPEAVFLEEKRVAGAKKLEVEACMDKMPFHLINRRGKGREKEYPRFPFAEKIFKSVTIECRECFTDEQLKERISRVIQNADGVILRGKGILKGSEGYLLFHYIPGNLKIESCRAKGNSLCFIGTGLKEQQIKMIFEREG